MRKPSSKLAASGSLIANCGTARRGSPAACAISGIERGDRVAIRLGNGLDWCLAFFGIQLAGAIAVPVNTRFSESEVEYVITDSGSKFVCTAGSPLPEGNSTAVEDLSPDDVSAIFYTSGTTGFPKGAMTTHEGFLSNIETCRRIVPLPFDGSLRTLVSVPLFHVTGCNSQLLPTCAGGGTTVIMPSFDVQTFLQADWRRTDQFADVRAGRLLAGHQSAEFLARSIRPRVRWIMYGGAPIAPDLVVRAFSKRFPNARVGNGFGLTETSSVATFLPHEYARLRPETVGFAAPVVDLKLDESADESGVGELLIRGPNIVKGYWNKPRSDGRDIRRRLAAFRRPGATRRSRLRPDRRSQERHGQSRRRKRLLRRSRKRAGRASGRVRSRGDGRPRRDDGRKSRRRDRAQAGPPGRGLAISSISPGGRLADFKVPQYVVIRSESLPRNPGGKILKKQLREQVDWGNAVR